jgi:putative methyltransferase (TIGR04325 family)
MPLVADVVHQYWQFPRRLACCRGVYASYHEARRAAARLAPVGYNATWIFGPEIIGEPGQDRRRDYPILFWLGPALSRCKKVLNLGGSVGAEYFTYRQFVHFPSDLSWLVWELPHAVKFGESLAKASNAPGLAFTDRVEDGDGADIVLTSGALQYFELDLASYLKKLSRRPSQIFVNRVPLYDGETFFTIQNVTDSVVPYRVQNRDELVVSLTSIGYRLVDCWWESHEIRIPFHPDRIVKGFHGFYFTSDDAPEPDWRIDAVATAKTIREKIV